MPGRARGRYLPTVAISVLVGWLGACQSSGGTAHCIPKVGMDVDQLAACGCLVERPGDAASGIIARSEASPNVRTIINVTYICPLGIQGIARVSVTNGVADAVYH